MKRKYISGLLLVLAAVVIGVAGTVAYFSDTEKSAGNRFTAGAIDLYIDSEAHYNGMVCDFYEPLEGYYWQEESPGSSTFPELLLTPCVGTWNEADLDYALLVTNKFFDYGDIKPGDFGENTISMLVYSNDAYLCAVFDNMDDYENGLYEPEWAIDEWEEPIIYEGELSKYMNFFAWEDDGDNIWEEGEEMLFEGPAGDNFVGNTYPLYTPVNGAVPGNGPIPANVKRYIGLYWCFGAVTVDDTEHKLTCDGSVVGNEAQTDRLTVDISFYIEQARHNDAFTCEGIIEKYNPTD